MAGSAILPRDFEEHLTIENAAQRFQEAAAVSRKIMAAGVSLRSNLDHAAIFSDPPYLVAGPLKELGYVSGWDSRCYPSPVDGCDYINVSARLPSDHPMRNRGWFDYAAVVHPVDEQARAHMLSQGYGNPFIHHLTWGIDPPEPAGGDDFEYASQVVPFMVEARRRIGEAIGEEPGTLIAALPESVRNNLRYADQFPGWVEGLDEDQYQLEVMQGGGFLLQFFVLSGGRIEVALRQGTRQTFNPKSVYKISRDEISAVQQI